MDNSKGELLFCITPKGVTGIKKVSLQSRTNKAFYEGKYPIHLFERCPSGQYYYMGTYKRKSEDDSTVPDSRGIVKLAIISEYYEETKHIIEQSSLGPNDKKIRVILSGLSEEMVGDNKQVMKALKSETGLSKSAIMKILKETTSYYEVDPLYYPPGSTKEQIVLARVNQNKFRAALDEIFEEKCCITNISERSMLRASHIIPWTESTDEMKTNPSNGLLLNVFHDALFDKYLMTVDIDGNIYYSDKLKNTLPADIYEKMCSYKKIVWPSGYIISSEVISDHNEKFKKLNTGL